MVAGGEVVLPLPLPSSSVGLGSRGMGAKLSYSVEACEQFEYRMGHSWMRKDLLASKENGLNWRLGRSIARHMEDGKNFQSAMILVGAQFAVGFHGGPVDRDVVEWVKGMMFPPSFASCTEITASGADLKRGELLSKQLKIEALELHGFGGNPVSNQVRTRQPVGPSPMGLDPICDVNQDVDWECTTHVCGIAQVNGAVAMTVYGSAVAEAMMKEGKYHVVERLGDVDGGVISRGLAIGDVTKASYGCPSSVRVNTQANTAVSPIGKGSKNREVACSGMLETKKISRGSGVPCVPVEAGVDAVLEASAIASKNVEASVGIPAAHLIEEVKGLAEEDQCGALGNMINPGCSLTVGEIALEIPSGTPAPSSADALVPVAAGTLGTEVYGAVLEGMHAHALELELQRIKGKNSIPSDVSPGSGVNCNQEMEELVRYKGCTQPV